MKPKIKIIIITLIFLSTIFISAKVSAMLPLSGKLIIVDAGHGGADPGTSSGTTYEKDINLKISKYLELELVKMGAEVILTRDNDYDLSSPNATYRKKSDFDNRIKLINESKGDMYVSIHLNYLNDSSYSGPQVFYNNDENKEIAMVFQETLNKVLNGNRQIKKIPSKTYMYDKLTIPGVLIECGFLSNYTEKNKLESSSYQQKIAQAIADAIINYY